VIVADTHVLAYLLLPYEFSPQADALFQRDPEWAVPILWRSEFRNLLAGYLQRKSLSFDEVLKVQAEAEAIVAGNEYEVESRRVLELVRDSDCSAYDCEFVALAARLGTQVVTMDAKLLKAFPKHTLAPSAP
jgi:predicted nucleic acid-binding protein